MNKEQEIDVKKYLKKMPKERLMDLYLQKCFVIDKERQDFKAELAKKQAENLYLQSQTLRLKMELENERLLRILGRI